MDRIFKTLKITALLLLIFVLAVLCAPTLKGPFVIIHFATTLKAWLLVQMLFLGFAIAAHVAHERELLQVISIEHPRPFLHQLTPVSKPLRC